MSLLSSRRSFVAFLAGILARTAWGDGNLVTTAAARPVAPPNKAPGLTVPDQKAFEGSISVGNGLRSLRAAAAPQGRWNTAVGVNAMLRATDQYGQTAVGYNALKNSGQGKGVLGTVAVVGNTAIGFNSMVANITGMDNTAVGANTLLNNERGYDNAAVGINALKNNLSGYENTAIGVDTLQNSTSGYRNIALGGLAGRFLSDVLTPKLGGNSSIYIGYSACGGFIDDAANEVVIGAFATGEGPNTVVIGNWEITDTYLKGKVHLNDNLAVEGKLHLNDNLAVKGKVQLDDDLAAEGKVQLNNDLAVKGKVRLDDDLAVEGKVQLNNDLAVKDKVQLNDDLAVEGKVQLNNDLAVTGKVQLSDDLAVEGKATAGGIELGYRDIPRVTQGLERGKVYAASSEILVEAGSSAGSSYSVYNESGSDLAMVEGPGLTLRLAGTQMTGNRILAPYGFVTIWFNSLEEAIIQGSGLS